jgi:hypothetical protein
VSDHVDGPAKAVDAPDDRLRELLGADPPPGIAALDARARSELADVIAEARHRQAQSLEEAFAAALEHLPFPARGVVKRVLFG